MAKNLISIKQVCALFGVTNMTVYLWRTTGLGAQREKIPHVPAPSGRGAKFPYTEAVKWAKKYGYEPKMDLKTLRQEVVNAPVGRRARPEI